MSKSKDISIENIIAKYFVYNIHVTLVPEMENRLNNTKLDKYLNNIVGYIESIDVSINNILSNLQTYIYNCTQVHYRIEDIMYIMSKRVGKKLLRKLQKHHYIELFKEIFKSTIHVYIVEIRKASKDMYLYDSFDNICDECEKLFVQVYYDQFEIKFLHLLNPDGDTIPREMYNHLLTKYDKLQRHHAKLKKKYYNSKCK